MKMIHRNKNPSDWTDWILENHLEISHGFPFSSEFFVDKGEYRLTTPGNFFEAGGFRDLQEKQKYYNGPIPPGYLLQAGDLIVAMTEQAAGLLGSSAIVPEGGKYLHNQRIGRITIKSDAIEKKYLFHLFNSENYRKEVRATAAGTKVKHTSPGKLLSIHVPIPQRKEQRVIASILCTFDVVISKTQALIAKKELRLKGLMQQLLTGKKRLRGFSGNWNTAKLNSIFERVTRKNDNECSLVVTISGRLGFVVQTDYFKKTIASEILDNYFLLRKGEFGYNKSYSNGYPWGAVKRLCIAETAVVTSLYICFRIRDESDFVGSYLESFFECGGLNHGLMRIAHEGGRAHGLLNVTPEDFFGLTISTPVKEEQLAIAQVLETAGREIDLLKAKADKMCKQKKGLMQVLLTGKRRLKEFRT